METTRFAFYSYVVNMSNTSLSKEEAIGVAPAQHQEVVGMHVGHVMPAREPYGPAGRFPFHFTSGLNHCEAEPQLTHIRLPRALLQPLCRHVRGVRDHRRSSLWIRSRRYLCDACNGSIP